jgi:hypothetical protein
MVIGIPPPVGYLNVRNARKMCVEAYTPHFRGLSLSERYISGESVAMMSAGAEPAKIE